MSLISFPATCQEVKLIKWTMESPDHKALCCQFYMQIHIDITNHPMIFKARSEPSDITQFTLVYMYSQK